MLSISLKRVMEVSPGFNPTNVVAGAFHYLTSATKKRLIVLRLLIDLSLQ